ncbi:LacI family DNA-binding transcriptional regulator [Asticcacaulis biprosthecium]|uniref:LacI family DNA-binding transcriptional regulator n=1 Tax=Asticcacaulis biprosthecium TaxID=76891 RepID=UPI001FDEE951|nr:LacI family DNA-binding transcriptional regulator [Asticcacaulis biprosthecium]
MDRASKLASRASSTGRATLDDVAKRVGVSTITVSRAFGRPDKVSEDLRRRIQQAADDLGYVRNRAASALASNRSMNIAVLVPSLSNSVFVDTVTGIEKVFRAHGYQMLMGVNHYSAEEEEALVRAYLAFAPDGMLLTGFNYREATRQLIDQAGIPIVHMMELSDREGTYSVGFSQEAAAQAMTEHLLAKGHRRIAFVASQLDPRTLARNRGYRDTIIKAGLYESHREVLVPDQSSVALGAALLRRLLEQAPDTDAVFFCNDDLAQGALFECLRRGIQVPNQLAVAGFNDLPMSECSVPSLTTIATPRYDIGVQSAHMLLALIEGQTVPRKTIDLGFQLRARESA